MKPALICGIGGQDGAYLAELLLEKGYEVFGTSRDVNARAFANLRWLDILDRIQLASMAPSDFRCVLQAVEWAAPDDFVAATGETGRLEDFVAAAFARSARLRDHVAIDPALGRPADIAWNGAEPRKAAEVLGWRATVAMPEIASRMVKSEKLAA